MRFRAAASVLLAALLSLSASAQDEGALQTLIDNAGIGGTVSLAQNYVVCDRVTLLQDQTLEGNSFTIQRCAIPTTTLTAQADATDTSVTVADGSVGIVGRSLGLGEPAFADAEEGVSTTDCVHTITGTTATTISFSSSGGTGLCKTWPIGTLVYSIFKVVRVLDTGVTIRNVTLDGNEQNVPNRRVWTNAFDTLQIGTGSGNATVENVSFINGAANDIGLQNSDGLVLRNSTLIGNRCAGVHTGGGGSSADGFLVEGNTFQGGADSIDCVHSEGAWTISNNNTNHVFRDNCFLGGGNVRAIGRMQLGTDNQFLTMLDNVACGYQWFFQVAGTGTDGDIVMAGNAAHLTTDKFWAGVATNFLDRNNRFLTQAECSCASSVPQICHGTRGARRW